MPVQLRAAEEYIANGGEIVSASDDAFRTHASDADPVVATFSQVLSPEECAEIIRLAKPQMSRAGVTKDDGTGGRQVSGRTNDSCWLPHDTSPQVREPTASCSSVEHARHGRSTLNPAPHHRCEIAAVGGCSAHFRARRFAF